MPAARRTDPSSSHAAAAHVAATGTASKQQLQTLAAVKSYPHRTSNELSALTGLCRYMLARRLPELLDAGAVKWSGKEAKRKDIHTGLPSVTWWLADDAEA